MKLGKLDQPASINPDRLNDDIKVALGEKYISMDTGFREPILDEAGQPTFDENKNPLTTGPFIILRLTDEASEDDQKAAEAIIAAHDPALLSTDQQRVKDRVDTYERFITFDFAALEALNTAEQNPIIVGLLRDIQKLMQAASSG